MIFWLGISLGAYVVAMVLLGVFAQSKIEADEDYLVAGRRLPLWLAWGTLLATWFGAATVLGASEAAREEGLRGTILDPFASGIALIVAGLLFAGPIWEMRLLTVGDLFARKYGRKTELVSSVVQSLSYLPWIAAQYLALAAVLTHFFGIETRVAIIGVALFVMFLTMIGGMWSVTLTDTAQILLVLVSLVVLGIKFFTAIGHGSMVTGVSSTWEQTPPELRTLLPEAGVVAMLAWSATWLNGIFGNIPGQDLMQRVFSARSSTVAKQACVLAGGVYILFGLLPVGLGLASRLVWPDELPQGSDGHVLLALAEQFLTLPMICLFAVAVVSIVVSTCTSALLSPSALLAHNLLDRLAWFDQKKMLTNRLSVIFVTAASLPIAFATDEILGLLEEAVAVALVALLVPFIAGVYGSPRGERPGLMSIIAGGGFWSLHKVASVLLSSGGDPPTGIISLVEMLPPELTGVTASLCGYIVGQRTSRIRTESPKV
ncbi:MAG: sodium:solute symporter [Planctomycetaceae bacterium]